ncbi:MAG TPA: beta-L-arabinofuranosidase domain-containing protein, partial [Acidimicrobiales bacterium]|nr:beta-L-arabinofuranosidase domain-containing protein [Acidimicrobiales bacterium]
MSTKTLRYRTGSPVEPRSYDHLARRPLEGGATRLEGGFWGKRQELAREVTIPHGMDMLEEWGCLDNLRTAAGRGNKEYRLPLFMDSDLYKVLEAISWERQHGRVKAQERFFAEAVGLLGAAQEVDGYINSYVQVVQAGKRFADPAMGHELYCAGHLFQAAVAEARSGVPRSGRRSLSDVADRFARYLLTALPAMPTYIDGHPEVEMALVELYREQGHHPYLALAEEIIARRGRASLRFPGFHADYFQDDVAVVDAKEVRGHAVRALYLLSGVTDAYMETGRRELLEPCLAQWEDMVGGKTYLTGGLGSRHEGEAFGERFELPSDRAYCET